METISLIKGLSSTIKKMLNQQNVILDDCGKIRHTISLTVQQQQIISNFMNLKLVSEGNLNSGGESSGMLQLTEQGSVASIHKSLALGSKLNSTQGHHKMDGSVLANN
jgi:hypothetical protein